MKYYEISKKADKETDKAYGFITGSNNAVLSHNLKYYYSWIPKSIVKTIGNTDYIPAWYVMQYKDNISQLIDFGNSIDIEEQPKKRTRRTKEQIKQDQYMVELNSRFNGNIPDEYIEYYYEEDDTRFTNIEKLDIILRKQDVIKIIRVKNGNREVIRG